MLFDFINRTQSLITQHVGDLSGKCWTCRISAVICDDVIVCCQVVSCLRRDRAWSAAERLEWYRAFGVEHFFRFANQLISQLQLRCQIDRLCFAHPQLHLLLLVPVWKVWVLNSQNVLLDYEANCFITTLLSSFDLIPFYYKIFLLLLSTIK